ncbi:thiol reductase thioredoxin [Sediminibacillus dalangtanensis]|uniref:Thiol reductase thioredoxin n=1 Tax=Sediminibacillus dalangtanensis TaxID=2729421 RepID=A0ABX7VT32_9BACI|nr:thioredoxin family protein [Sediminibacillus dalangtanensis]QTN00113.1 thiol reductase thioredoxin [Sediminibacillus dalangtanensis]
MKELESKEAFSQWKKEKAIFMFSADWCPDCRVIEPLLPEIEANYEEYTFIYVDRDKFIDLCAELDIFGIPSFLAFDHNKEIGRFVSKDRKTKEEIEAFIEKLPVNQ